MSLDDHERLLGAQIKETTSAFEQRWIALKRELRTEVQAKKTTRSLPWLWYAIPSTFFATLFALSVVGTQLPTTPLPEAQVTHFIDLLELEGELQLALPLTNPELTDTLLEMPL